MSALVDSTSAARRLAEWGLELTDRQMPHEVRRAAGRHLLDGIGCALAAVRRGEATYAIDYARDFSDSSKSSVLGSGLRAPPPVAAFTNGVLIHALDYDDTHAEALVHPTAAVLPAALAVGESENASGSELLTACIAGYEVVIRLGAAVRHGFHARGLHATSVCGVFASALVSCRLMRLEVEATVNALGIAGSMASGSLEFLHTGSSTKQLHPGFASQAGVMAARLAARGATGPESIFEGEYGVYRSLAGADVDAAALVEGLGTRWETTRITIKPYPACQLSHASLDALASVLGRVQGSEVDSITFEVPEDSVGIVCEPVAQKTAPRTPYEGKFSLPFSAASLMIDRRLVLESFEEAALSRRDVLELSRRVGYRPFDPGVAAALAPGRVEVRLVTGETVVGEVPTSRGGPQTPMSDEEVRDKFVSNCGGMAECDHLVSLATAFDQLERAADLTAASTIEREKVARFQGRA
ncbi:MAG: MmgE/PrpD family protein [Actinomycetota bacterium]